MRSRPLLLQPTAAPPRSRMASALPPNSFKRDGRACYAIIPATAAAAGSTRVRCCASTAIGRPAAAAAAAAAAALVAHNLHHGVALAAAAAAAAAARPRTDRRVALLELLRPLIARTLGRRRWLVVEAGNLSAPTKVYQVGAQTLFTPSLLPLNQILCDII